MKKLTLVSVILTLAVMLSACGSATSEVLNESPDSYYANDDIFYSSSSDMLMDKAEMESGSGYGSSTNSSLRGEEDKSKEFQEEKLVYTSNVDLETEDFDAANDTLHATIKSLGGIIVSENAYNLSDVGYRSLNMTVRIPQENYDTFLSGLSTAYNIASIRNSVDNLTEYYYDNANRLKSYRVQEDRLFAMLEKAETVEEMLQIESRLCDVQYQIEALTNTQKTIDNDVKYATFHISLNEVTKFTTPAPKTFSDRFNETVKDSGETFLDVLEGLLFIFIYLAPYLAIMAIITVIVIIIVKHSIKKNRKKVSKDGK
ncbi:MAG: DUF4349 domain-containing protein [Clostridia bacterium]|nr:DUF4349 domain-containing protein [Clostridia bacterium]